MNKATKIKDLKDFTGQASLYKLEPPIKVEPCYDGDFSGEFGYIVVSATIALFTGAETYIFPADKDGKVLDWGELDGSYCGGLDHKRALEGAGYKVT